MAHQDIPLQPQPSDHYSSQSWPPEKDTLLMQARRQGMDWEPIASRFFPDKTANACRKRHEQLMEKQNSLGGYFKSSDASPPGWSFKESPGNANDSVSDQPQLQSRSIETSRGQLYTADMQARKNAVAMDSSEKTGNKLMTTDSEERESPNNRNIVDVPPYEIPAEPDERKRRGRAAPPGRCHSCNRAETPEWRRGPDGARTLCNSCGIRESFANLNVLVVADYV